MNRVFRVVWNRRLGAWQVASEVASSQSRGALARRGVALTVAAMGLCGAVGAVELPTGGQVVAGQATVQASGSTMRIEQSTSRAIIDWQDFSVGQGQRVEFQQPTASASTLNRVLGSNVSLIQGQISANGQVFLVNPNGVLFTPSAQVDVGAMVASTLNISSDDFMAGRYRFEGDSQASVENQGAIKAAEGGTIALIAAKVINQGDIDAPNGNALLAAGRKVLLDLGGPAAIEVEEGSLDALVAQGGAIRAAGGEVSNINVAGTILSSTTNVGGVIGGAQPNDGAIVIRDSSFSGDILQGGNFTGGFIGGVTDGSYAIQIKDNSVSGVISVSGYSGGFAGQLIYPTRTPTQPLLVQGNVVDVNQTGSNSANSFGFVHSASDSNLITYANNTWNITTSGRTSVSAFASNGNLSNLGIESTGTAGKIEGIYSASPVYLILDTGSSVYGDSVGFTYSLWDTAAGDGTQIVDANASGTALWSGSPTSTSNVGSYSVTYSSGITLGNNAYTLSAGNAANWTITARPLDLSVTKVYDGNATLSTGFSLTGMVNGDAAPTLSGSATVSAKNVGSYSSWANSTLALSDSNYTLTGGTVAASITAKAISAITGITASNRTYDGLTSATLDSTNAAFGGMVTGDVLTVASATGAFADKNAADGKTVSITGLSLGGTDAGNYNLTSTTASTTAVDSGNKLSRIPNQN